jgi:hypothetical protein
MAFGLLLGLKIFFKPTRGYFHFHESWIGDDGHVVILIQQMI